MRFGDKVHGIRLILSRIPPRMGLIPVRLDSICPSLFD